MKRYSTFFLLLCLMGLTLMNIPTSKAIPAYEDFNSYSETDPNNHITINNSTSIDADLKRNEDAWLYKNYGVDYFENFTHTVDFKGDDINQDAVVYVWMVSNKTDDGLGIESGGDTAIGIYLYDMFSGTPEGLKRIVLRESYGGNPYSDAYTGLNLTTWYYLSIIKNGVNMTVVIYSDSSRSVVVDTLSLTLQANHKLPYVFATNSYNTGNNLQSDTIIHNLWIGFEAYMVTFYHNNGGLFRVDNATTSNGTINAYNDGAILELASLPQNSSYIFSSFQYGGSTFPFNPHNVTITSNMTIWLYFSIPEVGYGGFVFLFFGLVVGFIIGALVGFGSKTR